MDMQSGKRKREEDQLPSITYLVGDRSFDRLFKEQSLEEIQNVVRRKLQLPSNSTVKLKQLRGSKVIDLDDDDDFDAFSARARLMRLVDVAVEISQTPPTNGATSSASAGDASKAPETAVAKKKRKANNVQPPQDGDAPVVLEPKAKKQKTDQPAVSIAPKDAEIAKTPKAVPNTNFLEEFMENIGRRREELASVSAPAASSLKPTAKPEVLISIKAPVHIDGEPQKKKPKTLKAGKAKDAAEKLPKKTKKAKETEKTKETSRPPVPDDNEVPPVSGPSEPLKKSSGAKKIAAQTSDLQSVGGVKSANGAVNGAAASEKQKKRKVKGKEVESEAVSSEPTPETSTSTKGRKKVKIADASEAPAPKEKKTKQSKATKSKASDADAGRPPIRINIQDIVDSIARTLEGKAKQNITNAEVNSVNTSQPSISPPPPVITTTKGGVSSSPLCHACSGSYHPLYQCPTVRAGQEAIQNRLEELRKAGAKEYRLIIKDLESLLKSSSAAVSSKRNADHTKPSRKHLETDNESEGEGTKADKESQPSWTPLVPSHSLLSEVTVESRNEGSSSEEEDESAQELEQEEPVQEGHEPEAAQPSLDDVDLDAIMRGPTPIKLRDLIETMESKKDESDTEDEGGDIGLLEVEDDGGIERKYRRLSRRWVESSEEEGEDDDDSEQRSMPPPNQSISDPLPSTAAQQPSPGPDETSNATDPAGSRKDGAQRDAFDTDDTRVSVSEVQDSAKDSAKDDGEAPEAADLDKASDASPARATALPYNKADTNDDPIEPADDLMELQQVVTSDNDSIEVTTPPGLKTTRALSPAAHSTPKSGLAKRMRNRHGQLLSPSQFPVRADEFKVNGSQKAGAEEKKKHVAARTGLDKLSIRGGKGATRTDPLRMSSQPVKRSANLKGLGATPSHSQPLPKPPGSLAKWSTLREISPSIMMDELDSDGSPIGQGGILGELAGKASDQNGAGEHSDDDSAARASEPLFTLPASQVPFPYSQYNASVHKRMEVVSDSESEAEAGGEKKKKKTNAQMRRSIPPYRRLTDIASQGVLFSQSTPIGPGPGTMANGKGGQADNDDDDDDDSSSESDDEGQSHIPDAKRAGKLRSKKAKGLLASMNY